MEERPDDLMLGAEYDGMDPDLRLIAAQLFRLGRDVSRLEKSLQNKCRFCSMAMIAKLAGGIILVTLPILMGWCYSINADVKVIAAQLAQHIGH